MKNGLPLFAAILMALFSQSISAQCIELSTEAEGQVLCSYDTVVLEATPGFDTYRYYYNFSDSNEDGTLYTESSENTLSLPAGEWAVSYWYVETADAGCTEASGTVWWDSWVFQNPAVAHDANTMLCPGDSSLVEMPFPGPAFFQWSNNFVEIPGATSAQHWVTEPGMYTVAVAYAECPELWLSSGIGPDFQFYNVTPLGITVEDVEGETTLTASHGNDIQWYLDGEPIEGATNTELIPEVNGIYSATATDANGCLLESEPVQVGSLSAAAAFASALNVYPNPFADNLHIETGNVRVKQVRIFDLTGKPVLSEIRSTSGNFVLNLSEVARGIYFVEITSEDGLRHAVKVMKR